MANRLDPSWSFPTLFLVKDGLAGAREMIFFVCEIEWSATLFLVKDGLAGARQMLLSVTILSVAIERPATLFLVKDGLAGARRTLRSVTIERIGESGLQLCSW